MSNKNITFSMIKPDAVNKNLIPEILQVIKNNGFTIKAMKLTKLSKYEAEKFYYIHKGKSFFSDLIDFMTSGNIIALILEKENAIENYRKLIGNTNPEIAEKGTLRQLYAESITKNAVHGSDSDENAIIESRFFFSEREIF